VDVCKNNSNAVPRRNKAAKFLSYLVAVLSLLVSLNAAAQNLTAGDRVKLETEKDQLFQQMYRDPANLDVTFAYANISAQLGDYEAAVSALERMLLFNPNLPRVQLELGALYFRMGSFELARTYFEKAAAAQPPPPPEVRARVAEYLAQIEKSESRHHFSGYLFLGGQYQTDANVAGSSQILTPVFPFPVLLNTPFTKQASGSVFASGSAIYSYDLLTQNRDAIEVTSVGYLNRYFNPFVNRLDLALLEVTGGPRFNFPNGGILGDKPASVKPYLIGDEVGLGWNQYFAGIGPGVEYDQIVWDDLAVRAVYEFRHKKYTNAPDRPLSTGLNGNDNLVSLSLTKPIMANMALNLQFDYLHQSTALAYYSNATYAVGGSYRIRYEGPIGLPQSRWETSVFLGRAWSYYAAPDPCCNTSGNPLVPGISTQLTQRWRFGLSQVIPVQANIALVVQLERDIISSNLPLYAYNNTSVIVGPQINF
jgi:tetratricopeptide (TPR) repeat protein